jgi:hypothetical protein
VGPHRRRQLRSRPPTAPPHQTDHTHEVTPATVVWRPR